LRAPAHRRTAEELRRRLLRLDGLPLRPLTARTLIGSLRDEPTDDESDGLTILSPQPCCDLDPGWILAEARNQAPADGLSIIADRPWWPQCASSEPVSELLSRLWRHSVAVGIAARRLAREADDPEPDTVARAGQLCGLGYWAVAAVEPEWLISWWRQDDPVLRERMERADLGSDLGDLGRRLAERWTCHPLIVDSAWLHADRDSTLNLAAANPNRLAVIQEAYRWAEQTPWSLRARDRETIPSEPRLRILMAEVQARCGAPFVDPLATPHEERATRQNARLRIEVGRLRKDRGRAQRFLELLAGSPPGETPNEWADRASQTWCAEPGVGAARISWVETGRPGSRAVAEPPARSNGADSSARWDISHPPNLVIPLAARGQDRAVAELWCQGGEPGTVREGASDTFLRAWGSWAELLADRSRLEQRLQAVVGALRGRVQSEEERLARAKMDALGEFAAGAGHELNNPLAVIVGRAQILLAKAEDPEIARSLRIILSQAQRAHRILRDLMFVARPPAPRPRSCKPPDLLAALLTEFERECAARGVRLLSDLDDSTPSTWADPDGLRQLAEILLRNALQATPPGGRIHVRSARKDDELLWSFSDTGKGIGPDVGEHLFDPFFCGRQAGRGLGLGLPRAARIVQQAGGKLRWSSSPGHETLFHVHLPLTQPPASDAEPRAQAQSNGHHLHRVLKP
jgi:signal transduction histidine kinase